MHPRLAFLILPYTRTELPGWSRVMRMFGFGTALGGARPMGPAWKRMPKEILRGKWHGMPYGIDTKRSPIRHDVVLRPRSAPSAEFSDWLWK